MNIFMIDVSGDEACPNPSQNYSRPSGRGRGRGGGLRGRGGNRGGGIRQSPYHTHYYDIPIQDPNAPTIGNDIYTYADFMQEYAALSPAFSSTPEFVMPYFGNNYYATVTEELLLELLKNQM